ncbi:hypothetical protein GG681_03830 [Epibacterium sp. SM1969]|uniref:Uncharacterized protein n=1 Tax=Tritonibacter aquimaris TaxID=2663379 RepID=A0A844AX52_9RHOB|nr:DUF6525 family protein [Tritonibacter aquimaris]MQY41756.1 hypothetical protein [Tritonibacter aquimaris]
MSSPARANNRGSTGLRTRARRGNPMEIYDRLPGDLRQWMAGACLPWSPSSCLKIWRNARARGLPVEERLALLNRIEQATLKKTNSPFSEASSDCGSMSGCGG